MRVIKFLFLITTLVFFVSLVFLNYLKKSEIDNLLNSNYLLNKKIFEYDMKILSQRADLLYDLLIDKKVLRYVYEHSDKSREELIKYLYPKYLIIKKFGIYQFHFHLKGAISFVRFHKLAYFGDNLTGIRKSIILAQKEKKPIKGFELGRVEGGYRNVYPLIYKGKVIGSVEFSYSLAYFAKQLLKDSNYAFLIDKNSFDNVLFPLIKVNYKTFLNYYILYNNGVDLKNVLFDKKVFYRGDFIYALLPVKDIVNKTIGYLVVQKKSRNLEIINKTFNFYIFFAVGIFVLINLFLFMAYMFIKTKKISNFDELTGILNRRGCYESVKRFKKFGVLIFDIDFFKKVNDKFGHDVGDYVLSQVAKIVKDTIRKDDVFCRWGGEEFVIVVDNKNLEDLKNIAEKIRKKIEKFDFKEVGHITVSIGVAVGDEFEDTLKKADDKLYRAKREGRNRVIF
jgi:diguanylate cyclase (GGDEF)-like protein